ncbi:ankyrin repeat and IBR domain-containing protein 1-like [Babylonia areolata]|uniref:ankyrin repeat and IBR domain-containing protein 1-like n=1 Tax=Babylonia areolata TaxID=304850 RepID=UPI003FD3D645
MGSSSSKFRKHLQNGDEVQALQLYTNNTDLQKGLDPNCSYGDSHQHETPLHYAARHGMKTLLRIFLYDKGGNPNKTNAKKETALHCVCMERNAQYYNVQRRRVECLNMVLNWRGAMLQEEQVERIKLGALDEKKNTGLHYAAASGLKECVEILVQHGAPLSVENEDNWTPCESAEKNGHDKIARFLESKIVFSTDMETETLPPIEEYCGLRAQDLQEAKDQLLVETADMLSVPLFTAEALLRNHEWSRETLLEAWMEDPVACCHKCGVTPPGSLFSEKPQVQESLASPLPSPSHATCPSVEAECHICMSIFLLIEEPVHMTCQHQFCRQCWERYLNMKIQEGDAHHITCPGFDCCMLVPVEIIENIVSRDMALRYLQFDIKAFVDSNPDMKWCPFPGCGRAVKLPEIDGLASSSSQTRTSIPSDTSRSVDCGAAHYFCWECIGEAHEPCSCENWVKWQKKISDIKPETLSGTEEETEMAANCLWLVTNSKPCPNCKSPIQKNEGCNHMKCSKCKHDFCWVCLEQWKRHNSSTGGYFKCNRYEVVKKVEEQTAEMVNDAEEKNAKMQELNRFVHYYTRFKNHENSYRLEEPLLQTAKDKMMKLAEAVTDIATAKAETRFVEDAVRQLLKARRVLKCSYVYGYYLDGPGYKKIVFEFMQTELEECTEILSQMVNRLYLRTPRARIIEQAHNVQRRRLEFTAAIAKGLVPPETPPSMKKGRRRRKYSMETEDEDLRKAIMASIQEVDPGNPWIKDASGRHTNVMALLEWPLEDSDESDSEVSVAALREYGKCRRVGCNRPNVVNPRTQQVHEYCSRRCKHHDEMQNMADAEQQQQQQQEEIPEVILDEHMDLLRALEMSRLQYLRDTGLLHEPEGQKNNTSPKQLATPGSSRPRANSSGAERKKRAAAMTPMEELDMELQRVLELSSSIPHSSNADTSGKADQTSKGARHKRKYSQSRFEETTSTVVTRVPNKSVEDLYCLDCGPKPKMDTGHNSSTSSFSELSPGLEPHQAADLSPQPQRPSTSSDLATQSSASVSPDGASGHLLEDSPSPLPPSAEAPTAECAMFGTIKDLSVANIHATDSDKTSEFLSKDFQALFHMGRSYSSPNTTSPSISSDRPLRKANASYSGEDTGAFFLSRPDSYGSSSSTSLPLPELPLPSASADPAPEFPDCAFLPSPPLHDPVPSWPLLEKKNNTQVDQRKATHTHGKTAVALQDKSFLSGSKRSPRGAERLPKEGSNAYPSRPIGRKGPTQDDEHVSLLEMAENLLQMTAEMHSHIHNSGTHMDAVASGEDVKEGGGYADTLLPPPPPEDLMGDGLAMGVDESEDVAGQSPADCDGGLEDGDTTEEDIVVRVVEAHGLEDTEDSEDERPSFFV